jgi:hypothetical protein
MVTVKGSMSVAGLLCAAYYGARSYSFGSILPTAARRAFLVTHPIGIRLHWLAVVLNLTAADALSPYALKSGSQPDLSTVGGLASSLPWRPRAR